MIEPLPPRTRSPSPAAVPFPTLHSRYYFQDDMAVFLIEDCLFRVHRYHLDRESQIFPKSIGSKDEPIELPGVTRAEFENLLDFFYGGMHKETIPPLFAWTSLLSISTRFNMHRVRSRAIIEIDNFQPRIDPVDQVVLAVKHDVPEWLAPAYAALCQRADPVGIEEARKLGLETTVLLAKAREVARNHVRTDTPPLLTPGPSSTSNSDRCVAQPQFPWSPARLSPPLLSRIPSPQPEPLDSDLPKLAPLPPWSVPRHTAVDASIVCRVVDEIFWAEPGPKVRKGKNKKGRN